jgi:hypothetical protein
VLGNPQGLEHPVLVSAGQRERVGITGFDIHNRRIRRRIAAKKGRIEMLRPAS